ncbi:aspartate-semialdehyde dehydrogenase [Candidatus Hepatobacter penaei]|uniref:aspartate-semialdehyde dehydrogenase n=1 Tax=Candidatus Hepatobacter penaei TaxID=1274402 RepID=UPI0004F36984|nr:aspartate-semialdehyde dehydrogenase [Candidatus Hepatobacter penaei]
MRVVVLGATGAVGRGILSILHERAFASAHVVALASARSAGDHVFMGDRALEVRSCEGFLFEENDLVFSAVDEQVARRVLPDALERGARIIDKSALYRQQAPLVVPEVNGELLQRADTQIVCSPNCVVIPLVMALAPLHKALGVVRVVVSTYQSVSGAGKQGMDTLLAEMSAVMRERASQAIKSQEATNGEEGFQNEISQKAKVENQRVVSPFDAPIACNVLPRIGDVDDRGVSGEEDKIQQETRTILGRQIEVIATSVRVPTLVGHGLSVVVDVGRPTSLKEARTLLEKAPGCVMPENPFSVMEVAGEDKVFLGRLRVPSPSTVAFWAAADNLRKGAALNAVQIAEALYGSKAVDKKMW